jgi:hypothetical protein
MSNRFIWIRIGSSEVYLIGNEPLDANKVDLFIVSVITNFSKITNIRGVKIHGIATGGRALDC